MHDAAANKISLKLKHCNTERVGVLPTESTWRVPCSMSIEASQKHLELLGTTNNHWNLHPNSGNIGAVESSNWIPTPSIPKTPRYHWSCHCQHHRHRHWRLGCRPKQSHVCLENLMVNLELKNVANELEWICVYQYKLFKPEIFKINSNIITYYV